MNLNKVKTKQFNYLWGFERKLFKHNNLTRFTVKKIKSICLKTLNKSIPDNIFLLNRICIEIFDLIAL